MGIFVFIILFLFAPIIAKAIIGDLTGGNTLNDVTYTLDQRIESGLDYSKDIETYLIEIVRNRRYANDKVLDKLEHVDIVVSSSYVLNDYNNINRIKNQLVDPQ